MRPLIDALGKAHSPPSLIELRVRREEILAVAARRGAGNIRVFGSVVRGEQALGSDLDLIVDLDKDRSLFDLGGLAFDLEELLGCAVDVGLEDSFSERTRAAILAEAVGL